MLLWPCLSHGHVSAMAMSQFFSHPTDLAHLKIFHNAWGCMDKIEKFLKRFL